MKSMNIAKAPTAAAVIPFYAAAAVAFLVLAVLMFLTPEAFAGHYFQPKLLALVHTAVLGWGTMVILGATYQLLPVIFEKDLFSPKLAVISFWLLLPGIVLLVWSFWGFHIGIVMQTGGSLIVAAVVLFLVNIYFTASDAKNPSHSKMFIVTSATWLLITTVIGLLLVFNFTHLLFRRDHLEILKLHAHAGIAGWFLLLIIGVGSKLIPMFLLGRTSKDHYLTWSFYLINGGIIAFLLDGFIAGVGMRVFLYLAVVTAGIVLFLLFVYDCFKNRMRKKIDFQMKHTFLSMLFLVLAVVHLPLILLKQDLKCVLVYGSLVVMGWITSIILGKTFKTLPFVVWNNVYRGEAGKKGLPMPKDLYQERWVKIQFYIYLAGFVMLVAGIRSGMVPLTRLSALLFVVVGIIYNYNVFKIILHKPRLL